MKQGVRRIAVKLAIPAALALLVIVAGVLAVVPPRRGPAMLLVSGPPPPADRLEIVANGKLLATLPLPQASRSNVSPRVLFQPEGQTRFVFRILRGGKLIYRPEFDCVVRPGDILRCQFDAREELGQYFGDRPRCSFPALAAGASSKVWCWFGPADWLHEDNLQVTFQSPQAAEGFMLRALASGYRVVRKGAFNSGSNPWVILRRPADKTIVQALLEIEGREGVRSLGPEVTHVH